MDRVSRCTQAQLVNSIDAQLTRPTLGMCHNFYTKSYSIPGRKNPKTLMFFDGCATHLGCTVILRGASNAELKLVKQIMYFMIYSIYNWKLERSFFMDEFALVPPLPSENFDLDDQVFLDEDLAKTNLSPNKETDFKPSKENTSTPVKKNLPKLTLDETKSTNTFDSESLEEISSTPAIPCDRTASQTVSDFSDPLHLYLNAGSLSVPDKFDEAAIMVEVLEVKNNFKKALHDTILSCSPILKYPCPYLESDIGKNCVLRRFFPKELYFSTQFEKEKLNKRQRFSTKESRDPKDINHNIEFKDPHPFITKKLLKIAHNDDDFLGQVAEYRARGGTVRNICKCEMSPVENSSLLLRDDKSDLDSVGKIIIEKILYRTKILLIYLGLQGRVPYLLRNLKMELCHFAFKVSMYFCT